MENKVNFQKKPNKLINEKSPYLVQHSNNPVEWYPWGQEAFEKAKKEDKMIFLSIGYSSCHWCHVMEKECFEDNEVAQLLNETFVCIKVDREERPDVDANYMAVCQVISANCGWPLTIIMTPNKNPFFAASYVPKHSRQGLTGLMTLIPKVKKLWKTRRLELESMGTDIKYRVEILEKRLISGELKKDVFGKAYQKIILEFDDKYGGFGGAPKFPRPHTLLFLLRYYKRTKDADALKIIEKTLTAMRFGGIFDQVGFGFHRYSTDVRWLIPHFEKMLYDQALLTLVYVEAYQLTGIKLFEQTAKEILEYVIREFCSVHGGFYSAEDADSEGEEGKFYLWTLNEVKNALPPEDFELAVKIFNLSEEGNFFDVQQGAKTGKNILYLSKPAEKIAIEVECPPTELEISLDRIRKKLFETRSSRTKPFKDYKVLTDWNGLIIASLAKASRVFNEERYLEVAENAAKFILEKMVSEKCSLKHVYVEDESAVEGFLDDYAFFVFGLTELYQANFQEKYLQNAVSLNNMMLEKFYDQKNGGFYFTSSNNESGIVRKKYVFDASVPSGNAVAILNLANLSLLTGETKYQDIAFETAKVFFEEINEAPQAYMFMLCSLNLVIGSKFKVVLAGNLDEKDTGDVIKAFNRNYLPNVLVSIKEFNQDPSKYKKIDGKTTAYICREQTCMPPVNEIEKMLEVLKRD